MIVYKYFHPERIDVLENGMIRFSQPLALNDPFESFPDFTEIKDQLKATNTADAMHQFSKEFIDANVPHLESIIEKQLETIPARFGEFAVVLCLTKQRNNLLMWAHYTDAHKGFVIGFDAASDFFKPGTRIGRDGIKEVGYYTERPCVPYESFINMGKRDMNDTFFFTKSTEWAYEEELRVVGNPKMAHVTLPGKDGLPVHLFDFPSDCIKEVILGYRIPDAEKLKITGLLKSKYTSAELFQARLNPQKYTLDIKPVVP